MLTHKETPPLEVYRMAVLRPLYPYSISPEQTGHRYQSALIYLQTPGEFCAGNAVYFVSLFRLTTYDNVL